ncbi:DHH family phosphoesterase [bacterium]|nr:DHH family phosphoesterase [bacterium]
MIRFRKYILNEKLADKLAFEHTIDREVVKFLLRRNKIDLLPFIKGNIPLYLEFENINNLTASAKFIKGVIDNNFKTLIIYDSDLDGYGAFRITYDIFLENNYSKNINYKMFWHNIPIFTAQDAQKVKSEGYEAVILLDMGQSSNEGLEILSENNIRTLVVDHHKQDFEKVQNIIYLTPNKKKNVSMSTGGLVYFLKRQFHRMKNEKFAQQYIIFDTETTGFKAKFNDITEIAAYKIEGGEIISYFHSYLKTDRKIPSEITQITGIDNNLLEEKGKDPEKVMTLFKKFIGDLPIVAHNVNFDISFINEYFKRYGIPSVNNMLYDTVIMSRNYFKGLGSYALSSLVESLHLYKGPYHRATDDTQALYRLFLELLKKICNIRNRHNDSSLLIYYLTTYSDRMRIEGLNYLFLRDINKHFDFSEILHDRSYSSYLLNSYYTINKLLPVLNSKFRNEEFNELDRFFYERKIQLGFKKGTSSLAKIKDNNLGKDLNPNGKVKVVIIDRNMNEKRGMIASLLSKTNDVPALVLIKKDPMIGSSRFVGGDILPFFQENPELFESYGGHNKAVGFTISPSNIPELIERLEIWYGNLETQSDDIFYYDDLLPVTHVKKEVLKLINYMAPYDKNFPPPVFLDTNIVIRKIRHFGAKGKSLLIEFSKNQETFYGLSLYNWSPTMDINENKTYKILYTPLEKLMDEKRVLFIHKLVNM